MFLRRIWDKIHGWCHCKDEDKNMGQQEKCSFRQRGHKMADGSIQMVFGQGPDPVNADGSPSVKVWDHWVVESVSVEAYNGQDQAQ